MTEEETVTPKISVGSKQIGSAISPYNGNSHTEIEGPDKHHWQKYEQAARRDYIISRALNFQIRTMLASLGAYLHPNPKIKDFVERNLNEAQGNLQKWLSELMWSGLVYGRGSSEIVWEPRDGQIFLKNLIAYHPRSISLVVSLDGVLTDGKKNPYSSIFPKTGVWQELPSRVMLARDSRLRKDTFLNYVRIPLNKTCIVTHQGKFGNYDGESALAPIWDSYQRKVKTRDDLMITAERYGAPLISVVAPFAYTSNTVIDEATNQPRKETLVESIARNMENINTSTGLVIEEPALGSTQEKVRVSAITTGNNFGDSFLNTLHQLDSEILLGLGVPPLLFLEQSVGLGSGSLAATQADYYKETLVSMFKEFVEPFTEQVIGRLVYYNFGDTNPGRFSFTPFDMMATEKLMLALELGANLGIVDSSDTEDLQEMRARIGLSALDETRLNKRAKSNAEAMKITKNPNVDKIQIAKLRLDGQKYVADRTAKTQLEAAKISARNQPKQPTK